MNSHHYILNNRMIHFIFLQFKNYIALIEVTTLKMFVNFYFFFILATFFLFLNQVNFIYRLVGAQVQEGFVNKLPWNLLHLS